MREDEPIFLDERLIDRLHEKSLERFGGAPGVRDPTGLASAINAPRNIYHYENETDLFELAAAYAFHIAEAQAYLDGNKRTAVSSAISFLKMNRLRGLVTDPDRLYTAMIEVSAHRMARKELAEVLRSMVV